VEAYSVWGGIPRYWELAEEFGSDLDEAVDRLVLDPLSPLHQEPDRLLLEEVPPAAGLRPLLDAIGMGAHRLSEIGGRIGQPATALSRSLTRLQELDLVQREVPFGESERSSKRALYRIADPFIAFWFRVVAARRAQLAVAPRSLRIRLWHEAKSALAAEAWEALVRQSIPRMDPGLHPLGALGPWTPAGRFWQAGGPEWDVVALSADRKRLLLGEARWTESRVQRSHFEGACADLKRRGVPPLGDVGRCKVVHAVFLPEPPQGGKPRRARTPHLVTARDVLAVLR
jgi:AAA+ ATPase superfamily predicted ATPase